jgi:hypothetical protein
MTAHGTVDFLWRSTSPAQKGAMDSICCGRQRRDHKEMLIPWFLIGFSEK